MLAKVIGCTHSFLAGQAIEDYLAREAWQIAEIEQAIKEADADGFVSSDDDEQSFKKIRQGKEIKWLRKAAANLEAEYLYIAQDDPLAASQLVDEVQRLTELLPQQLAMGRSGRIPGTCELVLTYYLYIIPYRMKNNTLQILRIFHTNRRLPPKW
ncbi:type II toxin-antitoxin system RelE/ParE family toxin [Pectobacterium carotovorum]|uniref:type II toxin-antitoxin system RelE/ParE family toxin n=1 Tax=Pectobacterium carotovorum TaxID=554 RepID=UPI003810B4F4